MIAAAETESSSHNAALKRRTTMSGHRIPETALAENCSGFFDASRYEDLPCRFFFAERRPTLQVADSTSFFSGIRVALIPLRATLVNKEDCLHEKATHSGNATWAADRERCRAARTTGRGGESHCKAGYRPWRSKVGGWVTHPGTQQDHHKSKCLTDGRTS